MPILAFLCASQALPRASPAVEVWGIDGLGPANAGTVGDRLIRVDTADPLGTVHVVGSTGVADAFMSGMDFAADGSLYCRAFRRPPSAHANTPLAARQPPTADAITIDSARVEPVGFTPGTTGTLHAVGDVTFSDNSELRIALGAPGDASRLDVIGDLLLTGQNTSLSIDGGVFGQTSRLRHSQAHARARRRRLQCRR